MKLHDWQKWLSKDNPPWAAYPALMADRLIALDKNPGVRPIAIGEVMLTQCVIDHLCGGLQAGIEIGVQVMHSI